MNPEITYEKWDEVPYMCADGRVLNTKDFKPATIPIEDPNPTPNPKPELEPMPKPKPNPNPNPNLTPTYP